MDWGMSDKFGHISMGSGEQEVFLGRDMSRQREFSDSTAREIDEEVRLISEEAFDRALQTLKNYRSSLDKISEMLLEKEEISGEEVDEIIEKEKTGETADEGKKK